MADESLLGPIGSTPLQAHQANQFTWTGVSPEELAEARAKSLGGGGAAGLAKHGELAAARQHERTQRLDIEGGAADARDKGSDAGAAQTAARIAQSGERRISGGRARRW